MKKQIDYQSIDEMIGENLDPIIDEFDLEWDASQEKINAYCTIHDSDNSHSFYLNKQSSEAYWSCFTGQCHRVFRGSMIGLVRGLLSNRNGWQKPGDNIYSFLCNN